MTKRSVAAAVLMLAVSACAGSRDAAQPSSSGSAPRIVTLAPSLTEIAFAIGCGPNVVADTRYDDYPAAARILPHVADLTHVDLEALARLSPTRVLALHDQEKEGSEIVHALHLPVSYLPNRRLADTFSDIEGVGAACGMRASANALERSMRKRIETIRADARARGPRPRVLFLLGLPGFTAGGQSFLDDLIALAGGQNVAGAIDQPYPSLSDEAILAMDPSVIVVAKDTPFGPEVTAREPWRSVDAVRRGRVVVSPDDDILERPGPRIVDGLAWLTRAIHQ